LVIDDDSDAGHKEPFKKFENMGAKVITHEINMGKDKAFKTAFKYILELNDALVLVYHST